MSVTVFGSCRVSQVENNTNLNYLLTYTHTTKEVIQFIKFLKGDITIPEPYNRLCFRTAISNRSNIDRDNVYIEKFLNTETFVIEICSRKNYVHNGYYLHDISVNKKRGNWHIYTPPHILQEYTFETQKDEEIESDILEIQRLLHPKKILLVSHYNALLNGKCIQARDNLIKLLKSICEKHNISFVNPTEVLGAYNQTHVLTTDLAHYTDVGITQCMKYLNDAVRTQDGKI